MKSISAALLTASALSISAVAACGLGALAVDAAEIRADPRYPTLKVTLEGRIEAGDFESCEALFLTANAACT